MGSVLRTPYVLRMHYESQEHNALYSIMDRWTFNPGFADVLCVRDSVLGMHTVPEATTVHYSVWWRICMSCDL